MTCRSAEFFLSMAPAGRTLESSFGPSFWPKENTAMKSSYLPSTVDQSCQGFSDSMSRAGWTTTPLIMVVFRVG